MLWNAQKTAPYNPMQHMGEAAKVKRALYSLKRALYFLKEPCVFSTEPSYKSPAFPQTGARERGRERERDREREREEEKEKETEKEQERDALKRVVYGGGYG